MKRLLALSLLAALVAAPMAFAQPGGKSPTSAPAPAQPAKVQPAKEDKPAEKAKGTEKPKVDEKAKAPAADEDKPGPNHKMLSVFEGEWTAEVKDLTPGAETTDKGTMTCKMVYGGRFLAMDFDGRYHGKFFRGGGMWGYNNAKNRFEGSWADSTDTTLMFLTGSASADGKTFTMTGDCNDPITGKPCTMKEVTTIQDKSHWHTEYFIASAGKDTKILEVSYTKGVADKGEDKPVKEDKATGKDKSKEDKAPAKDKPATK